MKSQIVFVAVCLAGLAGAEVSGDRPDARHAWAVHDMYRPNPPAVKTVEGQPPSDAIRLFDGTAESFAKHWRCANGKPARWQVKDGAFVCVPWSGSVFTREEFADCQLHIEWKVPQGETSHGNSGVFLIGQYEVQIFNSHGQVSSRNPWQSSLAADYADGQAGAIYGQNPALVNASRPAGEWQSFDIVFHPQRWAGDKLIDKGSLTVFYNGVLVQDHWPLENGETTWCRRTKFRKMPSAGPIMLQDHGDPISFRNVWIRRIPSPYDNTTCGGPGVKEGDVAALRAKLAADALKTAESASDLADRMLYCWISLGYQESASVRAKAEAATAAYTAEIRTWNHETCLKARERLLTMDRFTNMLKRSGFIPATAPVLNEIRSALKR